MAGVGQALALELEHVAVLRAGGRATSSLPLSVGTSILPPMAAWVKAMGTRHTRSLPCREKNGCGPTRTRAQVAAHTGGLARLALAGAAHHHAVLHAGGHVDGERAFAANRPVPRQAVHGSAISVPLPRQEGQVRRLEEAAAGGLDLAVAAAGVAALGAGARLGARAARRRKNPGARIPASCRRRRPLSQGRFDSVRGRSRGRVRRRRPCSPRRYPRTC